MAQVTQETVIGGHKYSVTQLPAMRALRLLPLVGKALSQGPEKMFLCLTPDELEQLTRELLSTARLDGKELLPQFDFVMQGQTATVIALLAFAATVNFGDFYAAAHVADAQEASPSKA